MSAEAGRDQEVRLAEVASVIALAADLAVAQPLDHVLRSCAIATRFAEHLGVSEEDRAATYWFTLFMLTGCTAVSFELSKLVGDDIGFRGAAYGAPPTAIEQLRYVLGWIGKGEPPIARTRKRAAFLASGGRQLVNAVGAHCSVNVELAERLDLGDRVRSALAQSFAQWDGKGIPKGIAGTDIELAVRIGNLADVTEVFHRERGVGGALEVARAYRGKGFDPSLVDAWIPVAPDILVSVESDAARDLVMADPENRPLTAGQLRSSLELIADYSDVKSPWFAGHSRGVAALVEGAARSLGLPDADAASAGNAALVHDIGRSGVPNAIWDKAGPLTEDEREAVRLSAYLGDRILRRAGSLAHLAPIASSAHERAAGGGYPRGIGGETIPLTGRILAAADRYHAMREGRPHRPARPEEEAAKELRRMAREGEVDGGAAEAVLAAAGHRPRRRPSAPAGLTPREVEVLVLAARGATTRQVARRLGITPKTAGNHIERIYSKIGVSSRAEAAMFAMRNGLLSLV